jgi:hypothetical protein
VRLPNDSAAAGFEVEVSATTCCAEENEEARRTTAKAAAARILFAANIVEAPEIPVRKA